MTKRSLPEFPAAAPTAWLQRLRQAKPLVRKVPWWLPVALVAAVDVVLRWEKARFWLPLEWLAYAASMLYVVALVVVVRRAFSGKLHQFWPGAVLVLAGLSTFLHISHVAHYLYFGSHPTVVNIGYMLDEPADGWGNALQASSAGIYAAVGVMWLCFLGLWCIALRNGEPRVRRSLWVSAGLLVVLFTVPLHWNVGLSPGNVMPSVNLVFSGTRAVASHLQGQGVVRRLQVGNRTPIPPQSQPLPFNVVLVVQESLRGDEAAHRAFKRKLTPRQTDFRQRHKSNTVRFPHFYSNSTTTSESVPSLMTGVHPSQDFRTLHAAPLAYDYAEAFPGVHSFLYSAHHYKLANFKVFFQSEQLDRLVYAETSGHPAFNGLGIDDGLVVEGFLAEQEQLPSDSRFFGVLHLRGTHYPYDVPPEFQRFEGPGNPRWSLYDNTVLYADHNVGRLLEALERRGRLEDTVVIVTADHGEAMGEHRQLNGHRSGFYEEMVHVPFWVYLPTPLMERYGKRLRVNSRRPASNLDIVPTLVHLLGLQEEPAVQDILSNLGGDSLLERLPKRRSILVQNSPFDHAEYDGFTIIRGNLRLMHHRIAGRFYTEMFDVKKDPRERKNLWNPGNAKRMKQVRTMIKPWPPAARKLGLKASPNG